MKRSRLYLEEWGLFWLLSRDKKRQEVFSLLKEHLKGQGLLCSSVLGFQLLLRIGHDLGLFQAIKPSIREFEDSFEIIFPVEHRDIQRALSLKDKYQLEPEQALHISLVHGHGVEIMLGPEKPYGSVPLLQFIPLPSSL